MTFTSYPCEFWAMASQPLKAKEFISHLPPPLYPAPDRRNHAVIRRRQGLNLLDSFLIGQFWGKSHENFLEEEH